MPRRNSDEDAVLWRLVHAVGDLEKKVDQQSKTLERYIISARHQRSNQRVWLSKVRAELMVQKRYVKELETFLKLQREGEKL